VEDDRRSRAGVSPGSFVPLAVGILTVVAVLGAGTHSALRLSDRGPFAGERGPILAFGALLFVFDVLVIATVHSILRRRGRRPRHPRPSDRWQEPIEPDIRWLRLVLVVAIVLAVLLPLLLLLLGLRQVGPQRDSGGDGATVPGLRPPDAVSTAALWTLVSLAIAVVVIWTVMLLRRAGFWRQVRPVLSATEPADEESAELPGAAVLGSAVRAGAAALTAANDPRTAIIGCYEAMEMVLAEHGSARNEWDTPTELLQRAVAAGLVKSDAAGALTGLFREARFSHHPLGEQDRVAAVDALTRLRAELDDVGTVRATGRGTPTGRNAVSRHGTAAPHGTEGGRLS
jgi:hypothetical protein